MSEQTNFPPAPPSPAGGLFTEPPKERSFPTTPVVLAAVAILVVVAVFLVVGRHGAAPAPPTTVQPLSAYASSLELSNLQVSQSESYSGGRSTYVDGHIVNRGGQTVTSIMIQALFANDAGQTQVLTAPLAIIRTREPYVDTEPVSFAPLAPGGQADFRLIFEGVNDSWNQQTPAVHIIRVETR